MNLRFPEAPYSEELIQSTIETWEPVAGYKLTREDAEEILTNLLGYFGTLAGWAEAKSEGQAKDRGAA